MGKGFKDKPLRTAEPGGGFSQPLLTVYIISGICRFVKHFFYFFALMSASRGYRRGRLRGDMSTPPDIMNYIIGKPGLQEFFSNFERFVQHAQPTPAEVFAGSFRKKICAF